MPVLMEQGSCGRSFTLLPGVRCTPARAPLRGGGIEIGIVNNMPDAALEATERQFISLLAAASDKIPLRVRLFALPGISRGESARRYLASHYAGIASLWNTRLDGLIVTGTEPRCPDLAQEPYWPAFTELVDWAKRNTVSTIWSCLGAHAAVRHLDGVQRRPFADKCFGVFRCERTRHALTTPDAGPAEVPHSRWNGVAEDALTACGYDVLSRSGEIGPDTFVKEFHSLFVFLQGHPEYEPTTLLREYRRDVGRFLRRERQNYPPAPWRYFDKASTLAMEAFRASALASPGEELLESFPAAVAQDHIVNSWRRSAVALYRNWLGTISMRRQAAARTVAVHRGELARSP